MRRFLLFFVFMIIGWGMVFAQSGQKLSYQAVIRNSANQLVTNTQLEVTIGIANSENGAAVYTEHHTVTTNANGLISLMIGTGDNRTGDWGQIEWDHAYVTTNTVVDGVPVSHKVEITAVAHAFYADNVDEESITEVLSDHGIVDGAEPNVQGDWNQENTGADDYIKNKPNLSNVAISGDYNELTNKPDLNQYVTNVHLDDTLGSYYTQTEVNDTLSQYLQAKDLCDSIVNCDVIQNMRDSIHTNATNIATNVENIANIQTDITSLNKADSLLNVRITRDSIALSGKIHSDSAYLKGLIDENLANITTNTTNITNNTTNISNITNNITNLQAADSVLSARFAKDSIALSKRLDTMFTHICDSIEQCEVIQNMRDSIRSNAENIQTNATNIAVNATNIENIQADITNLQNADAALSARITADSILSYKADSVLSARIYNDSILSYKSDSVLSARIKADSLNLAQNYYNKTKINDTVRYILGQITTASGNLNDNYYTKAEIDDTLGHYTTNDMIDSLLRGYATNDTLKSYLTINGLCDSIQKCDVISGLQEADSLLGARITRDSILSYKADSILLARILKDSVVSYKTDSILLARILNDSVLSHKADSALLARILKDSVISYRTDSVLLARILNDSALSYKADSALLALILRDSANLADNYYNQDNITQILSEYVKDEDLDNYLTINGLCDSIVKCGVIRNMRDSIQTNAENIQTNAMNIAVNATNIENIQADITNLQNADAALSARITADSILSYKADSVLSARIYNDSILSYKSDSVLSARIKADSLNLAQNYYNKTKINDTVRYILGQITNATGDLNDNYYTKPEINDTLGHYTTSDMIDSLLGGYAKKDTLENYLTISGLCDSVKKCEVITNLQNADSLLGVRITRDSILSYKADSILLARILKDSVVSYKTDSILLARILNDSVLSHKADSALLARILKDSVISYRTDSVLLARILNDSALSYKADSALLALILRDSANLADNYYNQDNITQILSEYVKNEDLDNYLTINGLCDSIVKCGVIQNMRDSIRTNAENIQTNATNIAVNATNIENVQTDITHLQEADAALSARITADSILSYKADSVLSARIYNDSILSYKSDSVLSARIKADSLNLAQNYYNKTKINDTVRYILGQITNATGDLNDNYYTKAEINDTLSHYTTSNMIDSLLGGYAKKDTLENYLTISGLCDSIKKCEVIQTMRDSIRTLSDSIRTNAANITNNTTNITNITNNVTNITNNITNLQDIDSVLSARITRDSILSYKADSVLAARLIDTASKIREDFPKVSDKTITLKQGDATIGSFTLNQEGDQTITIPTPPDAQVQSDWNQSTTTAKDYIKNKPDIRDSVNRVVLDSLYAANSAMNKAIDTIARNASLGVVSDSTRMVFDTLHKYYATKDTLKNFVNKTDLCNNVMACEGIQTMQTSITDVKNNLDSTKVNIRNEMGMLKNNLQQNIDSTSANVRSALKDSLSRYLDSAQVRKTIHDSIGKGTLTITVGDGTGMTTTTFNANERGNISVNFAKVAGTGSYDDLKDKPEIPDAQVQADWKQTTTTAIDYIKNKPNIRDSVNRVVLDSLYAANSAMNKAIDTIAANISLGVVSDSVRMVFDTLHQYYATKDTLKNFVNKSDLCNNVMACDGIQTMQTSITDVKNNLDSTKVNIRNEMGTLKTNLQQNIDSTSTNVRGALKDSLSRYLDSVQVRKTIHDSIGNGTLTIKQNGTTLGTFKANQKDPSEINIDIPQPTAPNNGAITITRNHATIGTFNVDQSGSQTIDIEVPTKLSDLPNNGGHYAKRDSANVFTEANDFTSGRITVPSRFDIKNPPTAETCTQDAVNICDLLAVFDSLTRRIDKLERELEARKPSLTVTASDENVTVCSGSTVPVTYTATFHNCSSSDYTILWKVNGTDSTNVTGPTLTLNAENAGNHKVVCIATRSDNSSVADSVITTVTVYNTPSFNATVYNLTVTLTDVAHTATIQWDKDSAIVEYSDASATHTYSVADTITITATSANGCTYIKGLRLQATAPAVTTDSVKSVAATTAKAYGTVTSDGGIPETKRGMLYSTSDQNLEFGADGVDSVMNGTGKGNYACTLERLVPCTQYYVRAFAYNEVDTVYGAILNFTTPSFTCGSTLYDIDGNDYATLLLGSQCWMKQNLRTTHFANGDTIILDENYGLNQPRRYAPGSESEDVLNAYGYMYNWFAATRGTSSSANPSGVQGVCPDGWHLPSDAEWTQLTDFVASDPDNICGNNPINIIKSLVSQEGWGDFCDPSITSPACQVCDNLSTNNRTGFSALPTGTWENGATAHGYTNNGHTIFCTATAHETISAWVREFYPEHTFVERTAVDRQSAFSVRCVLDCSAGHTYKPTVSVVTLSRNGSTVSMTASVISDGGATVTGRGVCWGTTQHPTTSHTAGGTGIGEFTVTTENFTPGETYYVRAYAINSEGTAYGAEVTYVMPIPTSPTVKTGSQFIALTEGFEGSFPPSSWQAIDNNNDEKNWYLNNDFHSGSHCASSSSWDYDSWSAVTPDNYLITTDITLPSDVSPILTFWHKGSGASDASDEHFLVTVGSADASTVDDFDTELLNAVSSYEYTQAIVNLSSYAGQTIRLAFVHNTGRGYLCIDDIVIGEAGAGTNIVSNVTDATASCGGYVTDDGGATVTARGVCWSTSQNPTVSDSHTTDGSGTGSFTSNITGLNANTTYYVRAYATNSAGTTYGDQVNFTTTEALPEVTTNAVSNITITAGATPVITAICGGNVTDQGVGEVISRGVCWSASQNPTVSDSHTTDGSGLGSFTSNITGLTAGATYYVQAYATNSAGTAYGNQVSFTIPAVDAKSCSSAPTVTDHEGNIYATVQIGDQCWMRENLRTTTSPKTGTYLVKLARNEPGNVYSSLGSKVANWYMHDSTKYAPKGYGLLYNWCAAMDTANPVNYMEVPNTDNINGNNVNFSFSVTGNHRGICPDGWHLPNDSDWDNLIGSVGNSNAGKLAGGTYWKSSTNNAPGNYTYPDRNASGFTALPAGMFGSTSHQQDSLYAHFWGTMQVSVENNDVRKGRSLDLYHEAWLLTKSSQEKQYGLSVRCVRDEDGGSGGGSTSYDPEGGESSPLTFEAKTAGATVTFNSTMSSTPTVEYTTDGITWTTYSSPIPLANVGDKVSFRGNNATYASSFSECSSFSCSDSCYIYGNIMSLISKEGFASATSLTGNYAFCRLFYNNTYICNHASKTLVLPATTLTDYCYQYMFDGCKSLTTAPALPATMLANECYRNMFHDCKNLTTAPALPATTLTTSCYQSMFSGCTNLTTAPALPATTLAQFCYRGMFNSCTSLTTAPALPATTLASNCYENMFNSCSSLTAAPTLPATTLAVACYMFMFQKCSSLTTAPALPATTLTTSCYEYMFSLCTSLTTAPALPATTLQESCYSRMFSGCSNLNSVTCLATDISASHCTENWLNGVATSGTFAKAESMTSWTLNSADGIPDGWTPVNTINLANVSTDTTVASGWTITGTLGGNHKISIADGATVTLHDVVINGTNNDSYNWAGITCLGDATIILEGTNTVKGFYEDYPGIYVVPNKTLTIQGTGSLDASSNGWGAGIGGGAGIDCGNIVIEGGTVNANGGAGAAGIGGGLDASCGNISINDGKVTAIGGQNAYGFFGSSYIWYIGAGIGSGLALNSSVTCGDISISGGNVVAKGGNGVRTGGNNYGAGIGTGFSVESNQCGDISISGGKVEAYGAHHSAAIGNGVTWGATNQCGDISISGGEVEAIGGDAGAGIGNGRNNESSALCKCGNITIYSTVIKVKAEYGGAIEIKSIGKNHINKGSFECGDVIIGGVDYTPGVSQKTYIYVP